MKIMESIKIIDAGWIKKSRGFRVKYDQRNESGWSAAYCPDKGDAPMDSDVTAWRLAWKMARSSAPEGTADIELANVLVVDEEDNPVKYYATNKLKVFNQREVEYDEQLEESP